MSNRISSNRISSNRIGSIILTAVYAALAAPVLAGGPPAGDDKCLAAPNAAPSPGSHWYYFLDRAQQRRCWYLGPEGRPVHHAESDAQPVAKSAATPSPSIEAPLPPLRPATAPQSTARANLEGFFGPAREEPPAMARSPEPDEAGNASETEPGSASLRQMATARGKVAPEVAVSALVPAGTLKAGIIILMLLAVAAAAVGFIHHATFGIRTARRLPARAKGYRAGRIASLGSDKPPPASAARRPESRKHEPAPPIAPTSFEEEIQQIVRALESRAA